MLKISDLVKNNRAIADSAAPSQFAMHAMNKNANGELVYTKVLFANTAETINMTTGDGFAYNGFEEFVAGTYSDNQLQNATINYQDYVPSANQTISVRVVANSGVQYLMNGVQNPTLTLYRGSTYTFDTSDPSTAGQPLYISTVAGDTNYNNEYLTGVYNSRSANGGGYALPSTTTTSSPLIFVVPQSAPSQLYYTSGNSSIYGILSIRDALENAKYRAYNQVRFDNLQLNYYLNANGYLVARYNNSYTYTLANGASYTP